MGGTTLLKILAPILIAVGFVIACIIIVRVELGTKRLPATESHTQFPTTFTPITVSPSTEPPDIIRNVREDKSPDTTSPSIEIISSPETTSSSIEIILSPDTVSPSIEIISSPETTSSIEILSSPETTSPSIDIISSPETTSPFIEIISSPETTSPSIDIISSPETTSPLIEIISSPRTTSPSIEIISSPGSTISEQGTSELIVSQPTQQTKTVHGPTKRFLKSDQTATYGKPKIRRRIPTRDISMTSNNFTTDQEPVGQLKESIVTPAARNLSDLSIPNRSNIMKLDSQHSNLRYVPLIIETTTTTPVRTKISRVRMTGVQETPNLVVNYSRSQTPQFKSPERHPNIESESPVPGLYNPNDQDYSIEAPSDLEMSEPHIYGRGIDLSPKLSSSFAPVLPTQTRDMKTSIPLAPNVEESYIYAHGIDSSSKMSSVFATVPSIITRDTKMSIRLSSNVREPHSRRINLSPKLSSSFPSVHPILSRDVKMLTPLTPIVEEPHIYGRGINLSPKLSSSFAPVHPILSREVKMSIPLAPSVEEPYIYSRGINLSQEMPSSFAPVHPILSRDVKMLTPLTPIVEEPHIYGRGINLSPKLSSSFAPVHPILSREVKMSIPLAPSVEEPYIYSRGINLSQEMPSSFAPVHPILSREVKMSIPLAPSVQEPYIYSRGINLSQEMPSSFAPVHPILSRDVKISIPLAPKVEEEYYKTQANLPGSTAAGYYDTNYSLRKTSIPDLPVYLPFELPPNNPASTFETRDPLLSSQFSTEHLPYWPFSTNSDLVNQIKPDSLKKFNIENFEPNGPSRLAQHSITVLQEPGSTVNLSAQPQLLYSYENEQTTFSPVTRPQQEVVSPLSSAHQNEPGVPIPQSYSHYQGKGNYHWAVQNSDGTTSEQRGYLKDIGNRRKYIQVLEGLYSYRTDGKLYAFGYISDETGYRARPNVGDNTSSSLS